MTTGPGVDVPEVQAADANRPGRPLTCGSEFSAVSPYGRSEFWL
ncbi:hypothetical protein [Streptomyces clavifer]